MTIYGRLQQYWELGHNREREMEYGNVIIREQDLTTMEAIPKADIISQLAQLMKHYRKCYGTTSTDEIISLVQEHMQSLAKWDDSFNGFYEKYGG